MRTGYRPPASEALHAFCCECLANYGDGRGDCLNFHCPFYMRHKFRANTPTFDWVFDSKWAKHHVKRLALGLDKEEYVKKYIYNGKPILGLVKSFRAKCFWCMAEFTDGRMDCCNRNCPIYFWMPYRELLPLYNWLFELDYTERHRKRAFVEGIYTKVETDSGRKTIRYNVPKYVELYLPWHVERPVKRVRRAASR